jgi:hypothetical protein
MVGATIAGPLEDGLEAYHHGEYATAYQLLRPLAEKGDAVAQLNIALLFSDGHFEAETMRIAANVAKLPDLSRLAISPDLPHLPDEQRGPPTPTPPITIASTAKSGSGQGLAVGALRISTVGRLTVRASASTHARVSALPRSALRSSRRPGSRGA